MLARIATLQGRTDEPQTPVGWTRCAHCGYRPRCWSRAEQAHDLALIPDVDQGLAQEFYGQGVQTIQDLLDRFDETTLEMLQRPWGTQRRRVGRLAGRVLRAASALATGREIVLQRPAIPESAHYAIFDVEGLPPQLDELDLGITQKEVARRIGADQWTVINWEKGRATPV